MDPFRTLVKTLLKTLVHVPAQVLWLEEYLMRWKKTLVVVSHDREFLNNVTTDIIHLHDLGLHFYRRARPIP